MRPLLALVIACCVIGGLAFYFETIQTDPIPIDFDEPVETVAGVFFIELTLTFDAGPDAFAFEVDSAPSILVLFKGEEILKQTEPVAAGTPIVVKPIEGIEPGLNEFFVEVSAQDQISIVTRAVRLRAFRDDNLIAEQSLWSEPGEPIQGTMTLDVEGDPNRESADDEDHNH